LPALNLPGKPDDMDGSQVERYVQESRLAEVAAYCECDVINTYRLWLLYELFKGTLSQEQHHRSESSLLTFIRGRLSGKPHWGSFIGPSHQTFRSSVEPQLEIGTPTDTRQLSESRTLSTPLGRLLSYCRENGLPVAKALE
jgi:hypothetical protein